MNVSSLVIRIFCPVSFNKQQLAKAIVADPSAERSKIGRALSTLANTCDFKPNGNAALISRHGLERFVASSSTSIDITEAKALVQGLRNLQNDVRSQEKAAWANAGMRGSSNEQRARALRECVAALQHLYTSPRS
ncbi:hypothetical protein CXG43_00765 [Stenotrophomonas sp. Bg11-02]|nr:hypothetical protein [Stenotrophomonas sp. Bg11-02]PKH97788.1 hypothetical protein CXG43_00765 [Stenotrophomonas sp. Bg11-02]